MDYATGWTYSVSGSGVELEAGSTNVAPDATTTQNNTINGVTSTWTGLDLSTPVSYTHLTLPTTPYV